MKFNLQKSLLSIVLVILMTFSILTPAVSAADTKIDTISFGLYEPEKGDNPDFRVIGSSTAYYETTSLVWTEAATGKELTENDIFEYKKSYTATLTFKAKDGYAFDSKDSLKIEYGFGGVYQYFSPDNVTAKSCTVHVTLVCKPYEFKTGTISIDIPFVGKPVPTSVKSVSNPDCYTCTSFKWYDDETGKELGEGDFFGAIGKTYTAMAVVEAKEGYAFSEGAYVHDGRGNYYERLENTPQRIVGRRTYRCVELIDWAYMTITSPVEGECPDYYPVFPDDAHYILNSSSNSPATINGVCWKELADGSNVAGRRMAPEDTFQAGKRYRVDASITTESDDYYIHLDHSRVNGFVGVKTVFLPDSASFGYIFTCPETKTAYPLSVYVRSFLSEKEPITIHLMQNGWVKYTGTCTGARATHDFSKVAEGDYTVRISKKNHVTREYSLTVSGAAECSTKICPVGDVNLNGNVQSNDAMLAYKHTQGKASDQLNDYAAKCADVNGNGKIQSNDAMSIYKQAQGQHSLW